MIWSTTKMVLLVIGLIVLLGWLAGCQTTPVQSCAPVPLSHFQMPPVGIAPAAPGMTEEQYLETVVKPAVEAICEREYRLRVACEHQRPCRGDSCPPVAPECINQ